MRIVRYELEIVDYQQIQPLWPGRILAVKPGRYTPGYDEHQKIDVWCIDDHTHAYGPPPVLGVWIVGTGNPMPAELVRHGSSVSNGYCQGWNGYEIEVEKVIPFQDTCVMANGLVWHVFSRVVGYAAKPETGYGIVSSVDDVATTIADRRRDELQRVADMDRRATDA